MKRAWIAASVVLTALLFGFGGKAQADEVVVVHHPHYYHTRRVVVVRHPHRWYRHHEEVIVR